MHLHVWKSTEKHLSAVFIGTHWHYRPDFTFALRACLPRQKLFLWPRNLFPSPDDYDQVYLVVNPERSPKPGAGSQASVQISMRLTPEQRAQLDRATAEMKLSRAEVVRRAVKAAYLQRAIGPKK
jgi:hypothetical protein